MNVRTTVDTTKDVMCIVLYTEKNLCLNIYIAGWVCLIVCCCCFVVVLCVFVCVCYWVVFLRGIKVGS